MSSIDKDPQNNTFNKELSEIQALSRIIQVHLTQGDKMVLPNEDLGKLKVLVASLQATYTDSKVIESCRDDNDRGCDSCNKIKVRHCCQCQKVTPDLIHAILHYYCSDCVEKTSLNCNI
jgi:hypothetical protein